MRKERVRIIVIAAILLVLYHLVVFLIPFGKTGAFWVSYGFSLVSLVVVTASMYIAFINAPDAKSRFYGFPIARIGVGYGLAQLVAGLVVMALGKWIPGWIPVLVFAIGLGAAVIGLVCAETVTDEIRVQDAKLKKDVTLMRSLQSKVSQMAAQTDDGDMKALADSFRYSDPVSAPGLTEIEGDLMAAVDELQVAFVDGDSGAVTLLCKKTAALLAERNRLCKLGKN